jgi:hypothetical protein
MTCSQNWCNRERAFKAAGSYVGPLWGVVRFAAPLAEGARSMTFEHLIGFLSATAIFLILLADVTSHRS